MKINQSLKAVPAIQSTRELPQDHSRTKQHQLKDQTDMMQESSAKNKVKTTVEKMNDFMEPVITDLKFVYHDDLDKYYVTVIDPATDEIIKEIPPKKMLDMYAAMAEYMGILVDKKV